jgi:hypothetical protein
MIDLNNILLKNQIEDYLIKALNIIHNTKKKKYINDKKYQYLILRNKKFINKMIIRSRNIISIIDFYKNINNSNLISDIDSEVYKFINKYDSMDKCKKCKKPITFLNFMKILFNLKLILFSYHKTYNIYYILY